MRIYVRSMQKFLRWIKVSVSVERILLRNSYVYVLLLNFKSELYFQIQFLMLLLSIYYLFLP